MSYSYTYITFMVIYYIICYVLFSCIVIMYCFHVLFSCTVYVQCSCTNFIYCIHVLFHVLFSYTVFLLYFSYYFLFHACKYQRSGYRKLIKGPKALYALYETVVYKGPGGPVIIVRDNDHLIKGPKALW